MNVKCSFIARNKRKWLICPFILWKKIVFHFYHHDFFRLFLKIYSCNYSYLQLTVSSNLLMRKKHEYEIIIHIEMKRKFSQDSSISWSNSLPHWNNTVTTVTADKKGKRRACWVDFLINVTVTFFWKLLFYVIKYLANLFRILNLHLIFMFFFVDNLISKRDIQIQMKWKKIIPFKRR